MIKLPTESPTGYGFTISRGRNRNQPITFFLCNRYNVMGGYLIMLILQFCALGLLVYRHHILKVGDRILKVNGVNVKV